MTATATGLTQRRPIYALITGDFVSQLGNAITSIALPWFVLETTGSAARTGIVFVALFLPVPIVTFFGGALVDRARRTRLSVIADVLSGVSIALIPILHYAGVLSYGLLLLLVFTGAVLDGPGFSARRSLVPALARRGGIALERANSAFQINWSASVLLGPAAGGVLVALTTATTALWVDAGTFLISGLLVALMVPEERPAEAEEAIADERVETSYLQEVWGGVRWIANDRRLTHVLVSASVTMTLVAALMVVILPVYAEDVYEDPVSLGILVAGFGLGSLIGSLGFGYLAEKLAGWRTYLAATALVGAPLIVLALEPSLVVATMLGALIAIAFGPIIPSMDTLIQARTSDAIRGRVFSTRFALNSVINLPGLLIIGVALEAIVISATLIALGLGAVAMAGALAFLPGHDQSRVDSYKHRRVRGGESTAST